MCPFTCSGCDKIRSPKYQLFQDPKFTIEPSCSTSEGFLLGSETNVMAIFVEINFAPECEHGTTKVSFLMNLEPILRPCHTFLLEPSIKIY